MTVPPDIRGFTTQNLVAGVAAGSVSGGVAGRQRDFDLILFNLHLPDESGFEFCRRVKAEPRWARVEARPLRENGQIKRIAFPGDIGNPPSILLHDIDYPKGVDYTLVESAYGNRIHESRTEREEMLLDVITETYKNKGVLMIPSFAVERTQELLLQLDSFFDAGRLPKMPVYVDSPMALEDCPPCLRSSAAGLKGSV